MRMAVPLISILSVALLWECVCVSHQILVYLLFAPKEEAGCESAYWGHQMRDTAPSWTGLTPWALYCSPHKAAPNPGHCNSSIFIYNMHLTSIFLFRKSNNSQQAKTATPLVIVLSECYDCDVQHRRDLLGCCRLTELSCWLTCSFCQRRRGMVERGSSSLLPVSGGSHAKLAEYYTHWRRDKTRQRFWELNVWW